MFLTNADGRLIASIPAEPTMIGRDFRFEKPGSAARAPPARFYVSPVHPRSADNRNATDIVGADPRPGRLNDWLHRRFGLGGTNRTALVDD